MSTSKVEIPLHDTICSVLSWNESTLNLDQVENLIEFCSTKEETGLMKIPRIESKLRVFSFKIQFPMRVSNLTNSLNIVISACDEIRGSKKFKGVMQTLNALANALNHGTERGKIPARGFQLKSLVQLTATRPGNPKMTLMHYLCKVLAEKIPKFLDFPEDLASLEASTKIQLKDLGEEMQAISKELEKAIEELSNSENDGPISETFCLTLKDFISHAESEVRSLASLHSNMGRNVDALALYFEDSAQCPFEQVVSTVFNFERMFVRAREENCIKLERRN